MRISFSEPTKVVCYSGHVYPERPVSFLWEGNEQVVNDVEKEWLEPGERHFRVRTDNKRLFELCYHEDSDQWFVMSGC